MGVEERSRIPKLDDANWAGTPKSNQCTDSLTEGDSAKTMAISVLSVVGRTSTAFSLYVESY
jgi:DNA topoisomerase-2